MIMMTLEMVWEQVKTLSPEDRRKLLDYIQQDEKSMTLYYVSSDAQKDMYDTLQPLRQEAINQHMTKLEIDSLIDEVLDDVRSEQKAHHDKRGD
jgi:Mg/Co/Ni transporter MgtE